MLSGELEKAQAAWGKDTEERDCIAISPLGTRQTHNTLIYHRLKGRVQTGWLSDRPCFEGTLEAFEQAVDAQYLARARNGIPLAQRRWDEYKLAIEFLRRLPPLADQGAPESGLGEADREGAGQ